MSGTASSPCNIFKNVKWTVAGMILVICMLSTTACLHVEVKEPFDSNIKNHQESSYGSLAAFDGTKTVYYYADYDGVPGIYKMDTATSETEFVVSCNDVKKIQIKDDNLYYLEYELDIRDKRMSTKGYRLMKYNFTQKKIEKVPLYDRWGCYYGTWDFHVGDKGIIFTDLTLFAARKTTVDATGIKNKDGEYLKSMRQIGKPKIVKGTDLILHLYSYGDLYCISIMNWGPDESDYVADWGEIGIYDKKQDEPVLGNSFTAKIVGQDSGLFLTYGEQLVWYDAEKHKILKEYFFEDTDRLNNTKVFGDTLTVFGKNKNQNDQIFSVDSQTGTVNKLFEASEEEHVLYYDQEQYILFDQGKITKYTYFGDEVWTANLGKIRNTEGYKTDSSGDWLFVTHWNKRKKVRELDAIINLVTGDMTEG